MKLYLIKTSLKDYYVFAKQEWEARDKVMDALSNEVRSIETHGIINIQELASTITGQSKGTLII
jgi:hypothetical protein